MIDMIDIYLRTDTAEVLAAACPFLRSKDEVWA